MARSLMFQGTGSSVGKSLLVAGVARALTRQGLKVLPFKPQNMSNNAAVTKDGGEIGRAQALQALACKVDPIVHMNPVLLKPQTEIGSQIIVQGKIWGQAKAREYQQLKKQLLPYVKESFDILAKQTDIVLIEGAGSASEINLRDNDIANMGFAQAVQSPVILIGDIDRGGVIASLIGTKSVLSQEDQLLIKGFIVNKMRGDPSLFTDAMDWISYETGWQNIGLLPYFSELQKLPAEDAADLKIDHSQYKKNKLHISVLLLPTISNFDDFDPLKGEPNIQLNFIALGQAIPTYTDVILIPGSKNTISDLQALYQTGWDIDIKAHVRQGKYVLGICGGYQMLGQDIYDEHQIEGKQSYIKGLGMFNHSTYLEGSKSLQQVKGNFLLSNVECSGYEMHVGKTKYHDAYIPFIKLQNGHDEGTISPDGKIIGTYLHGLFHHNDARKYMLEFFGSQTMLAGFNQKIENILDQWADHIENNISLRRLLEISLINL